MFTQEQYREIQDREAATDYTKRPDIPEGFSGWIAHARQVYSNRSGRVWGSAQFFQVQNARLERVTSPAGGEGDYWVIHGQVGKTFPGDWRPGSDGYPIFSGFVRTLTSPPILLEEGTPDQRMEALYALAYGETP